MPDGFAAPVRVSTEAIGRARALRRRIDSEDQRYVAGALRLLGPVRARLRRHPARPPRAETLAALECQWHRALTSIYRLGCSSELTRDSLHIEDTAISAATLKEVDWDGDAEPGLAICVGVLVVKRGEVSFTCAPTMLVSLHAMARWIQRHSAAATDAMLLDDIALVAGHTVAEVGVDRGFSVHTAGGSWRGRAISVAGDRQVLSVRTWVAT